MFPFECEHEVLPFPRLVAGHAPKPPDFPPRLRGRTLRSASACASVWHSHVQEAEAGAVAVGPFEIIHQALRGA
jgi:hypothetical protein